MKTKILLIFLPAVLFFSCSKPLETTTEGSMTLTIRKDADASGKSERTRSIPINPTKSL